MFFGILWHSDQGKYHVDLTNFPFCIPMWSSPYPCPLPILLYIKCSLVSTVKCSGYKTFPIYLEDLLLHSFNSLMKSNELSMSMQSEFWTSIRDMWWDNHDIHVQFGNRHTHTHTEAFLLPLFILVQREIQTINIKYLIPTRSKGQDLQVEPCLHFRRAKCPSWIPKS